MNEARVACLRMMRDIAERYAKGELKKADLKQAKKEAVLALAGKKPASDKQVLKRPASAARPTAVNKKPATAKADIGSAAAAAERDGREVCDDLAKQVGKEARVQEAEGSQEEEEEEVPTHQSEEDPMLLV